MTSFKSAYLIATSKDADKVIFLMDRIELGTQSLEQYNNFADTDDFVQSTENTHALITKLKSSNPNEVLIVSSIQKMSNIKNEEGGLKAHDIEQMQKKRYADEKGLYLEITPSGGRFWRLKYRFNGRESTLTIGSYPEISLAQARRTRDEARIQLY